MNIHKTRNRGKLVRNSKPSFLELDAVVAAKSKEHLSEPFSSSERSIVVRSYTKSLLQAYNGVAIDYDGTVLSLRNRESNPSLVVARFLTKCLERDLPVLMISGRGESLLKMRSVLSTTKDESMFYAMYNGTRIIRGSSSRPIFSKPVHLARTLSLLHRNFENSNLVHKWSLKKYSIQVMPSRRSRDIMDRLCSEIQSVLPNDLTARNSGYSVDIYPKTATKDQCLDVICKVLGKRLNFLRIGDQGHSLGNDYELLDHQGGFSVGTISSNPETCFPVFDVQGRRLRGPGGADHLLTKIFQFE